MRALWLCRYGNGVWKVVPTYTFPNMASIYLRAPENMDILIINFMIRPTALLLTIEAVTSQPGEC